MTKPSNPESELSSIELMSVEDYSNLKPGDKRLVIEGHIALIASYGWRATLSHVASAHPDAAGYGPPGAEEKLHRSLHQDLEIPPVVIVKDEQIVAYTPLSKL